MDSPHKAICEAIDQATPDLLELSDTIHANPELGFQEHESAKLLTAALERYGATVERGVAEMETAFLGCWATLGSTPVSAWCASRMRCPRSATPAVTT